MSRKIYRKSDVLEVVDPLARLLRVVLFREGVTLDKLNAMHARWVARHNVIKSAASDRQTLRNILFRSKSITWSYFLRILIQQAEYDLEDVIVVLKRKSDGQVITFKSSDTLSDVPDVPEEHGHPLDNRFGDDDDDSPF